MTQIERAFVTIREGQVHLRRSVGSPTGRLPLWMVHASPASSITVVSLMRELGAQRAVIAPDTLGNGDSAPPAPAAPDIAYYADSSLRVMDALGIERADLYGSHTGAHIVTEMAIARPDRFGRVILDGIGMFSPQDKQDHLAHYTRVMAPDFYGSQFHWAWHFVRDQAWFFPHYRQDAQHLRGIAPPSADTLHDVTVEVLKSIRTYHLAYRAAFAHPDRERLKLLRHRTLSMADIEDPLRAGVAEAASLLPDACQRIFESAREGGMAGKAALLARFLDSGQIG